MLTDLFFRLRSLFRRGEVESELDDELRFHCERQVQRLIDSGLPREEAMRRARLDSAGLEEQKENCRDARGTRFFEILWQDLRFALRLLRKSPGFIGVAVLTLALGIGANTAIFSVAYAVLIKALPYPHPDRLVMVWHGVRLPNYQSNRNEASPGNFADWKSQNTVFEDVAGYRNRSFNLTGAGEPLRVEGEAVSAGFFSVLQTNATLGRVFTREEDRPDGSHVLILSDGLWKSRFGADPQILGKTLLLDGYSYTVVGVMPLGFHFPDPDDQIWVPLALSSVDLNDRGSFFLYVVARMKPHVLLQQAQTEMRLIARHLTELHPDTNEGQTANVVSLRDDVAGPVRPALLALVAAVGFVLLIVCANLGSLLLARSSTRQREIAIRLALGAGRASILRQILTENVLLAVFGCALGLLLARWGVSVLKWLSPAHLPRIEEISLNTPVLLFSIAISILAALLFGLAPALYVIRANLNESLREGTRETASGSRLRARSSLVVLEIALGLIVAVGAGLLFRSLLALERTPLGFQPHGVLTMRVIPRGEKYSQISARAAFYRQVTERIRSLPGVQSAAAVTFIPLTFARGSQGFTIEGQPLYAPSELPIADYNVVTPGYFATMQIPLREGRDFSWSDAMETSAVIIINESMARRYWPNEDPLGKRIKAGSLGDPLPWLTVAGVVGDIRQFDVLTSPRPAVYFPTTQFQSASGILRDWVVRTAGDPVSVADAARAAVWDVDKDLPVSRVRTMEQVWSNSIVAQRFNLVLFGLFAILGLILAAVGIYGVIACSVTARTREIGIRLALGAQPGNILRLVINQGIALALAGTGLGVTVGLLATRYVRSLLYGVEPTDLLTFVAVATLLVLVALVASYIPARRATRVDPIIALRYE